MLVLILPTLLFARKSDVIYSGIFTSGAIEKFPLYTEMSEKVSSGIASKLQKLQQNDQLEFNLQFETNSEMDKWDINDPFSLGVLVTRDDISIEAFTNTLSTGEIIKNFKSTMKVGMVIFAYQTIGREKKRNIVYTAQFLDYDTLVTQNKALSKEEELSFFYDSFMKLFDTKAVPNLKTFGVGNIVGQVESYRKAGGVATINVGLLDGVEEGLRVQFGENPDEFSPYGTVVSVDGNQSKVKVTVFDTPPTDLQKISIRNLRGQSDEIFQVTNFSISSKKAEAFYKEANYYIGEDISQFFTDFLATKKGKVVLPSRTSSWITGSVEQAEAVLVRNGQSFSFAMPKPTHPILLTLSGLGHNISEENAISVITGFKGWLICEIPSLGYSKESELSSVKRTVKGVQEYSVFDVYYDLLLNLTSKSIEELEL